MSDFNILAGDIGGTKTNLAIFSSNPEKKLPIAEATFASRQYTSLEKLTREFLFQTNLSVTKASFCVAGPVVEGRAHITNLPWVVDEAALKDKLGLSNVRLFNDLFALAHAVPQLKSDDTFTLNPGQGEVNGSVLVVAPGTGLGQAYLNWNGTRYCAYPSEGGHADFAPRNELEAGLLQYMYKRFDHVSYERVCSGIGLPNIYSYLKDSGFASEPKWLAEDLAAGADPAAVIFRTALRVEQPSKLCRKALETFVSILGAAAGNGALHLMTLGGVYLGGGIPPLILPYLTRKIFMRAFTNKGRFSELMTRIPVHVILNPKSALFGAAALILEGGGIEING